LLLKVLEPLKKTILFVKVLDTTLANCFIALICLASTIKKILIEWEIIGFWNHIINSINEQWNSFNNMLFVLAESCLLIK